jgi:hypothetical protein
MAAWAKRVSLNICSRAVLQEALVYTKFLEYNAQLVIKTEVLINDLSSAVTISARKSNI